MPPRKALSPCPQTTPFPRHAFAKRQVRVAARSKYKGHGQMLAVSFP